MIATSPPGPLLAAARRCLAYVPGAGTIADWRCAFDDLAGLKREAARGLLPNDRGRIAVMVGDLAILAANAGDDAARAALVTLAHGLADFADDGHHFRADGNFRRVADD
jgi:hypothetical protein